MNKFKTAVVCPVFNEDQTWHKVCKTLTTLFDLVVVVDDGSQDPIDAHAVPGVVVLRHARNLGKGTALETGFRYCLAQGAHVIGTIDSDAEHDPRCLANPARALGDAGMVSFSRESIFASYSLARRWRNVMISSRLSRELGVDLKDTQSGLRLFSAGALRSALGAGLPPGYAVETLMLRAVVAAGHSVQEVEIAYPGCQRPEKRLYNAHALRSDLIVLASTILGGRSAKKKPNRKALRARKKLTT